MLTLSFQSTPSAWRETLIKLVVFIGLTFQSTPSAWRETRSGNIGVTTSQHFNPLPPHGGRHHRAMGLCPHKVFQSTPSAWRETRFTWNKIFAKKISIHSLRMEGDLRHDRSGICRAYFNPLPPHGGRHCQFYRILDICIFQSTPSAWRETIESCCIAFHIFPFQSTPSAWRETLPLLLYWCIGLYFNPLPPHGGRRFAHFDNKSNCCISIHSLRMEGDDYTTLISMLTGGFQSTPSAWRETVRQRLFPLSKGISIHSLRMEGDPSINVLEPDFTSFQSTPSAWRETAQNQGQHTYQHDFNPLPPHGGRLIYIPFSNV